MDLTQTLNCSFCIDFLKKVVFFEKYLLKVITVIIYIYKIFSHFLSLHLAIPWNEIVPIAHR